jgi:hypothetical protein
MNTLTRLFGFPLMVSVLLSACAGETSPVEREMMEMEPAPPPPAGKCTVGQVLTCFCMTGGAGTQRCLDTGVFGECSCRASEQPQKQVDCQPGSRVVCDCPNGGKGNHLCRPDSTFEPCSMCIGGQPDADAG